ncbi:MFS transporter [Haladaptatus sp. NG-SE-30]
MSESRSVIWRYCAYKISNSYGFYLPVGILYLTEVRGYGLGVIGLTQAAFLLALMAAEIPTGYIGDRIGRRASLALGNSLAALSLGTYVFLDSPLVYVLVNVVWAIGWGFQSGTGEAWLYELLDSRFDASEYTRISGRASTVLLVTSAVTAAAAGVLVSVDWSIPFLANAALAALGIPILFTLPAVESEIDYADTFTVREATHTLRLQVGRPEVRCLVAYTALFYRWSRPSASGLDPDGEGRKPD